MTQAVTRAARKAAASRRQAFAVHVWQHPAGKLGALLTAGIVLLAVIGYLVAEGLTGYSPTEFIGYPFDSTGPFGTDALGRSVGARFLAGGLALIWYALVATALGVLLGGFLGVLAASLGGVTGLLIRRITDVVFAFPPLVLALLVIVVFGPSGWILALCIGVAQIPRVARVARAATLAVTSQDYLLAARLAGMSTRHVLCRELLPNIRGALAVETALRLSYSVGVIASLSFLGFGVQPPAADWGMMVNENRIGIAVQPWAVLLPLAAIAVLSIGISLITEALTRTTALTATQAGVTR